MGLCENTKSTSDWCTWKWWGEWNPVGKHSSGYYPGELPQPSRAGQHSNSGNAENPSKILHEKINPKKHDHQILQGQNQEKLLKAAKRKARSPTKGSQSVELWTSERKPYNPEEIGVPIFNILKAKNFQPRVSYSAKLRFISKGEIRSFSGKQMLRPALKELLKEALNMERNNRHQPLHKHAKM